MTQTLERLIAEPTVDQTGPLQATLVELIELSLQAKQAHWNVTGPTFKPIHEFLDEITDQYRGWYDDVAERLAAIGEAPDGRSATVAASATFESLPAGQLDAGTVAVLFEQRVDQLARRLHVRAAQVGAVDLASQDLLVEILRGVEKQRWMLRAHRGR